MAGIFDNIGDTLAALFGGGEPSGSTAEVPERAQALLGGYRPSGIDRLRAMAAGMGAPTDDAAGAAAQFSAGLSGASKYFTDRSDYTDRLALEKQERERQAAKDAQQQANWEEEHRLDVLSQERQNRIAERKLEVSGITDYDRRREEAEKMGIEPGSPEYRSFVLTGKLSTPSISGGKPPVGFRWADESMTELEPIPGGPGDRIPGELAARVGLADNFLKQVPDIRQKVKSGVATGAFDRAVAWTGRGEQGEIDRQISSGVDALQRLLTGAGMNMSEAEAYARRYSPKLTDDVDTVLSKLDQLTAELESTKAMALRGRGDEEGGTPSGAKATPGTTKSGVTWSIEE